MKKPPKKNLTPSQKEWGVGDELRGEGVLFWARGEGSSEKGRWGLLFEGGKRRGRKGREYRKGVALFRGWRFGRKRGDLRGEAG